MTVDWSKPDLASTKTNFPGLVRELAKRAATLLYTGDSNLEDEFIQYERTLKKFQRRSGGSFSDMIIDNVRTTPSDVTPTITPSAGAWTDTGSILRVMNLGGVVLFSVVVAGSSASNFNSFNITHASLLSGSTLRGSFSARITETGSITLVDSIGKSGGNGITINKTSGNWTAGNAVAGYVSGVTFY